VKGSGDSSDNGTATKNGISGSHPPTATVDDADKEKENKVSDAPTSPAEAPAGAKSPGKTATIKSPIRSSSPMDVDDGPVDSSKPKEKEPATPSDTALTQPVTTASTETKTT